MVLAGMRAESVARISRKNSLGKTAKGRTTKDLVRNAKHSKALGRM
jgi:hypothetical protein